MKKRPDPQAEVDEFNRLHAEGTMVEYWRGLRQGEPSGKGKTRTAAQVLSGHTAVVWIEGCSGCISLSHVRALEAEMEVAQA